MKPRLKSLYQQLYDLTNPKCKACAVPQSCCSPEYCELAAENAAREGVVLEKGTHPKLPYMTSAGCSVAPYLRPLCTLHVCSINSLGFDPRDQEFTDKYFKIRDEIEVLEFNEFQEQCDRASESQHER